MAAHNDASWSKPFQAAEVPFQAMTCGRASASSAAAARNGCGSNCANAAGVSEISVTGRRAKCAVAGSGPDDVGRYRFDYRVGRRSQHADANLSHTYNP